ncbi:MAG: hypothetical protein IKF52_06135 [Clostridia bacterium]|nr:hypothetical protein [Clostridia bacterium]
MKNKKGLIIGIIVLVVLAAAGVGGYFAYNHFKDDKDSGSSKSSKNDLKEVVGKYDLIEMSEGDETYTESDLETLKTMGLSITMELKDDGTGVMTMYGEDEEFEYDEKNITVNGVKTEYKYKDGKLTVEEDDTKMVFEKK